MKDATKTVSAGRDRERFEGAVNPPVYRASTILSGSLEELRAKNRTRRGDGVTYGAHGTPTTFALEEALAALEGGYRTRLCGTGVTAVAGPLLCYLSAGDHLLMTDGLYGPTRDFCDGMLRRLGVETSYYDPLIGGAIAQLIRPNTRVIFMESPSSDAFEMQDVPAIAAAARAAGCLTMIDNTWGSPLFFKPLAHGVDVSVQAVTKYVGGHADLLMGAATTTEAAYPALQRGWQELGLNTSPDDAYLALRGLRSVAPRMRQHQEGALALAAWLGAQAEVLEVLHPALPSDPGHALWRRDFTGAASLFGFVLDPEFASQSRIAAMLDGLKLFGVGYSWGGYQSLLIPTDPHRGRVASVWPRPGRAAGRAMRIHVGLEDPEDLIAELDDGFQRMRRLEA